MKGAISWFADLRITDRPTVGGKGASLGELTHAGIDVPPGFVVTTHAFEQFLAALEAREPIRPLVEALVPDDLAGVTALSRTLRARIENEPLPPAVEQAILEAPEGAVIVLAGKGNDAIQRVRGGYVHYDSDPVVARRALALREKQRT